MGMLDIDIDRDASLDIIKYQLNKYANIYIKSVPFDPNKYDIELIGESEVNESNWDVLFMTLMDGRIIICERQYIMNHYMKLHYPVLDASSIRYNFLSIKKLMEWEF